MYTYFSSLSILVCLKPGNKMLQKREPGESLKPKKRFIQDAHETEIWNKYYKHKSKLIQTKYLNNLNDKQSFKLLTEKI